MLLDVQGVIENVLVAANSHLAFHHQCSFPYFLLDAATPICLLAIATLSHSTLFRIPAISFTSLSTL